MPRADRVGGTKRQKRARIGAQLLGRTKTSNSDISNLVNALQGLEPSDMEALEVFRNQEVTKMLQDLTDVWTPSYGKLLQKHMFE